MAHIGCSRHPVVGKFHHKGHGLSLKGGLFKDQCHEDPHEDPKHIKPDHHQSLVLREKGLCKEGVDRKLGRTAHKRRQENGHLPVPLRRKGPAGHDSRHRAAEAHQHGDDAPSGKAQLS